MHLKNRRRLHNCMKSFTELIADQAINRDKIAVYSQYGEFSYKSLYSEVLILADWLRENGIFPNLSDSKKPLLIEGDGEIAHIAIILAAMELGLPFIPLNRAFTRSNLLTEKTFLATHIQCDKKAILIEGNVFEIRNNPSNFNDIFTKESINNRFDITIERLACCFPTSGTTGLPKLIAVSNYQLIKGAYFVSEALDLQSKDILMGMLSLDFDYGLNQILGSIVAGGSYICVQLSTLTRDRLDSVAILKPTVLALMPFLIDTYFPAFNDNDLESVKLVTTSGGPLTSNHREKVSRICPKATIIPMYGLSEGFRATISNPDIDEKYPDSVGVPIGDTEITIRDDEGIKLTAGKVGEIWQSGGCLSWGYWNDIESTHLRFVSDGEFPNKTWLKSGDLGYINQQGVLFIVGRKTFQIKKFGHRVSIDEVEKLVSEALEGSLVVAVPVEISATESDFDVFVQSSENLAAKLAQKISRVLSRELWPRKLICLERIPINIYGGKPDRQALSALTTENVKKPYSLFSELLKYGE